jgi:signal transduction histidine kinase
MQFLQAQKLAALGVMAGGIAHEIRNPLAICSSAAQFLMEDATLTDFRRECVEKIHAGIQRASIIIENLLRFARPSPTTDLTQINLIALLNDTLVLIANQARIQKIELITNFSREPILITGNASVLQQVFVNLFMNAIDAMPNGGSLSICMEKVGAEVLIHIVDTGCGMSSTEMDRIFDPFYTTSPVGRGTGLGLSICYSIIKRHFGSIEVESVKGNGSTFHIRLPLS